jgi:hypothetical protein
MHCLEPSDPFGGYPILLARGFRYEGAILELESIEEFIPVGGELRAASIELGARFLRAES